MWRAFYEGSDLLGWPLIALAVFVVTFILVVIRVFAQREQNAKLDDHLAALPLLEDGPLIEDGSLS